MDVYNYKLFIIWLFPFILVSLIFLHFYRKRNSLPKLIIFSFILGFIFTPIVLEDPLKGAPLTVPSAMYWVFFPFDCYQKEKWLYLLNNLNIFFSPFLMSIAIAILMKNIGIKKPN